MKGVIEPRLTADGRVTVDMGAPVFALADIPFDATWLSPASPEFMAKLASGPGEYYLGALLFL